MASSNADPDHAEVAFHPPFLLLGCLVAGGVLQLLAPAGFLPEAWRVPLGPLVVVLAFALFGWAVATFRAGGASIPTSEPTGVVVAHGPYRFGRNPIYLAMLVLQLGIAIWADSAWFLATLLVSLAALRVGVIQREERYLERKFGSTYAEYRARVRRWL